MQDIELTISRKTNQTQIQVQAKPNYPPYPRSASIHYMHKS